ncbi:hypothetical protein ACWEPL_62765 [Nonomuraea sp. NPDC004186]
MAAGQVPGVEQVKEHIAQIEAARECLAHARANIDILPDMSAPAHSPWGRSSLLAQARVDAHRANSVNLPPRPGLSPWT